MTKSTWILTCLFCFFTSGPNVAQGAQNVANLDAITSEIIAPLTTKTLPINQRYVGVWVGILSPTETFSKGFGETNIGSEKPPTDTTFFEIGSISKTFTGISLAMSNLNIENDLQFYLPKDVVVPTKDGKTIKLRHLVTHTSGLPSEPSSITSLEGFLSFSPADAYNFLKGYSPDSTPGEVYNYSNLSFGLLSHVLGGSKLEYQTRNYENLVGQITKPLGMTETLVFLNDERKQRLTNAYDNDGHDHAYWNWGENAINAGCGALKSTGHDLLIYLKANLGQTNSSIKPAIIKSHEELFKVDENLSIGFGWHITKFNSEKIVWHNGGTGGFQTFLGFNKERGIGVVLLANTIHYVDNYRVDPRIDIAAMKILNRIK